MSDTTTRHDFIVPAQGKPNWRTDFLDLFNRVDLRLPWNFAGDPNGNLAGQYIGQLVYDTDNNTSYACSKVGDAETAEWKTPLPTIYEDDLEESIIPDLKDDIVESIQASLMPVGTLYHNGTDSTNPAELLGFGEWEPYGTGRSVISVGTGTDVNGVERTFAAGETGGEYEHTQTVAELAPHTHDERYMEEADNTSAGPESEHGGKDRPTKTGSTGGGEAMPWMQPYIVAYVWIRTA